MLGEKFAEQIEQLRFGVLKSLPIRESSQVWISTKLISHSVHLKIKYFFSG